MSRRSTARALVGLLSAALCTSMAVVPAAARPAPSHSARYTNAVSSGFADTFADPSLLRGKDGWWYAYGTSDPLREGEGTAHRVPVARSHDLVTWTHVGDAFSDANLPTWAAPGASIWAPDIRYVDGQYRMYYVVTETTVTPEPNDNAVGMATSPTPTGPWTDSGAPVVGPRRGGVVGDGNFTWTFDPSVVTDTDGSQWMFYGSYYGGIFVTQLTRDGTHVVGNPSMVAVDNKFEGAYPVHRNGFWYLFASTANCCAGPTTGYSVQVGRSRSLRGPYVDREGTALTASRAGGTPVLVQNGNRWVGAGHNAVVTDLAGQDWVAYHAIDRSDPFLDGTDGINERSMLLDRLDWVGGWPAVRAGAGPSDGPTPAPITRLRDDRTTSDRSTGVRVEADLRSTGRSFGLVATAGKGAGSAEVLATVDPAAGEVRLRETRHGVTVGSTEAPLPAGFRPADWHSLSLQVRAGTAQAQLSNARLGDPLADLHLRLHSERPLTSGRALGPQADVANLSVLAPVRPVTRLVREHVPTRLDRSRSDEFGGGALGAGWSWVRQDAAATVTGGALIWPTEAADLTGTGNDAGVLLRDPGVGDWAVETKLTTDLGVDDVRNYQQGGLIAYVDDDLFTRLSHVAIWNTRQTEFGKEMPYAGRLSYGGTIVGPPAETTWLRISQRVDRHSGEHELRGWSSRDGRHWVEGGVWTLPAGADVRVGLVSHGGAGATNRFDYLRVYRNR